MIAAQPNPWPAMPCGLYIHIPFCDSKCGYCDFYSVAVEGRDTGPAIDAIMQELRVRLREHPAIETIFLGGGTPTILSLDQLDELLTAIRQNVDLNNVAEYSVEANPATVDDAKALLLRERGVTRVSMGAQSFFPAELATLERLHSPDDIAPSVDVLRRNGIENVNIDLIFGIPGQTMVTWRESLCRAIDLGVDHLACYGLTFEPGTRLTALHKHGRMQPCDEELEADMFLATADILADTGFEQYEISNYARPGRQCQHNLIYWRNEPYIGIGPSAVGCVAGRRYRNAPDFAAYARMIGANKLRLPTESVTISIGDGSSRQSSLRVLSPTVVTAIEPSLDFSLAEVESECIGAQTLLTEMILMQLRLTEGLSLDAVRRRCGVEPLDVFEPTLTGLINEGLLQRSNTHISLTRSGRLISNRIMADLAATADRT